MTYTNAAQAVAVQRNDRLFDIVHAEDGSAVTRIDANVYDAISGECIRYEQPKGIVLKFADCLAIGVQLNIQLTAAGRAYLGIPEPVLLKFKVDCNTCEFGIIEAENAQAARDIAAQMAGYESEMQMEQAIGTDSEIEAVPVYNA